MTSPTEFALASDALRLREHFDRLQQNGTRFIPDWLRSLRQRGLERFSALGFPSTALEDWRFTNVAPITRLPFQTTLAQPESIDSSQLDRFGLRSLPGYQLVFVDGHFAPGLSRLEGTPAGVRLGSVVEAVQQDPGWLSGWLFRQAEMEAESFVALNAAFFQDGALVFLPADCVLEAPIQALFISSSQAPQEFIQPHNVIVAQQNSRATVIESYVSLAPTAHLTNSVTELTLGEGSVLEHVRVQDESLESFHVALVQARQAANSRLISHSISLGARLARHDIRSRLEGQGASSLFNGLYVAGGDQLVDHHTIIDHAQPNCSSHEFYHGILDGRSQGVFNGKIFVQPGAQKTDAKQTNRNLLLSADATIDTKPQLEIFADDVKCTHGATVGQLEEEAVFYLRSRGIGLEEARRMLIHAFAGQILDRVEVESVRGELDRLVLARLAQGIRSEAGGG